MNSHSPKAGSDAVRQLLMNAVTGLQRTTDSARLDAEVLMAHVLKRDRSYLYTWPEHIPTAAETSLFLQCIEERKCGVPIAYLTGFKEFWSMSFRVTTDTLVPRTDTETLVQLALDSLADKPGPTLDLGTGCGAIAISLAKELEHRQAKLNQSTDTGAVNIDVSATDNSVAALNVARDNARRLQAPVSFYLSDWFTQVPDKKWQLIVSNPPYLAHDDLHLPALQHEPPTALVAPENGLGDIAQIAKNAKQYLQSNGTLMFEHGEAQGPGVQAIMQQAGYTSVNTTTDIAGRDRVTTGHWHG